MLCFGQVCASPCALNVSAALQGAYRMASTEAPILALLSAPQPLVHLVSIYYYMPNCVRPEIRLLLDQRILRSDSCEKIYYG